MNMLTAEQNPNQLDVAAVTALLGWILGRPTDIENEKIIMGEI